jgi:hypothetical protein
MEFGQLVERDRGDPPTIRPDQRIRSLMAVEYISVKSDDLPIDHRDNEGGRQHNCR